MARLIIWDWKRHGEKELIDNETTVVVTKIVSRTGEEKCDIPTISFRFPNDPSREFGEIELSYKEMKTIAEQMRKLKPESIGK